MFWLPVVQAARATDVDTYDPSVAFTEGYGTPQGESAEVSPFDGLSGGVNFSHSEDAVQQVLTDGSIAPAVSVQDVASLTLSYTLAEKVRISALLPAYAEVGLPMDGIDGKGGVGDLRLTAAVPLWADRQGNHTFGLVPRIGLPTAPEALRVSNGFGAELVAAFTGRQNEIGYSANASVRGTPNDPLPGSDLANGSTLGANVGVWWIATEDVRFGGEFDVDQTLGSGSTTVGMIHGFAQAFTNSGVSFHAGAGAPVVSGIGAPPMRLMAGFSWANRHPDTDWDGVPDDDDLCADALEDRDGVQDEDGCVDPDDDADGTPDELDYCEAPEDKDGFEDGDGCPELDNDADGLVDTEDRCPDAPGTPEGFGCADVDGDQVPDPEDQCPEVPGTASAGGCPDADGDGVPEPRDLCPTLPLPGWVARDGSDGCPPEPDRYPVGPLTLDGKISFQAGTSTLDPASTPALEQLALLLSRNPQLAKVEISAHVDNVGDDAANKALTLQQAEVVVGWLVQKGVAAGRLSAVGAGESVPLFSNRTEDGRSKNRRVEIKVLDATVPPAPPGGAASPTGPQVVRPSPSGPAPTVPAPAPVVVPP